jgi:hypothetical protein
MNAIKMDAAQFRGNFPANVFRIFKYILGASKFAEQLSGEMSIHVRKL